MRSTSLRAALSAFVGLAVLLATLVAGFSVASAATRKTTGVSTLSGASPRTTSGITFRKVTSPKPTATATATPTKAVTTATGTATATPTAAVTTAAAAPSTATTTAAATTVTATTVPATGPTVATTTAAAAPTTATTTTAAPAPTAPRFGMSYGERLSRMTQADLDATLDDATTLGLGWIRADLSWTTVQGGGATSWNWSGFDRVVLAAQARGLKVLPILAYTPAWARDAGCVRFSCPPADPAQFAAFATAAVNRYSAYGVSTWEVWNEPNLAQFWPVPDPVRYGALLTTTSAAIKKADPDATVLLGGLAALESTNASVAIGPREYLNAVCLTGACSSVDAISYHPYTYPYPASYYQLWNAWSKMSATPTSLRSVLGTFGLGAKPIWVTEYGAPTDGDGTASDGTWATTNSTTTHVTEAWQASLAKDAVQKADSDPGIGAFFYYTNQDLVASTRREASFGLRRLDGTPKPAWQAYKDAVAAAKAN